MDVAVVGCGPVGLTLAALLGEAGHSVVAFERYPGRYGLPRAASFDGETMRTFAGLGIGGELGLHPQKTYEWRNGAGELLIAMDCPEAGPSGWPDLAMFHQPSLEHALHARCAAMSEVDVRYATTVTGLDQHEDHVTLRTDHGGPVSARYVVGCDGGNSFVREALGIGQDDLGFAEPWLVCDFALRRPAAELGLPSCLQIGDPAEPTTVLTTGARRQRFCFMLEDAGEIEEHRTEQDAWTRVARYLSREEADLERVATYVFRSLVAHRWRERRVLLAGDAAHQMPPFLGQGLCSGVRDAVNLAFKLDLVLRGGWDGDVLDTYQSEREPHVRGVLATSMELGRQHTLRDPALARERDARLVARRGALGAPERISLPDLGPGLLGRGGGGLSVQGRAGDGRRTGRLDDLVGGGFRLLVTEEALPGLDLAALGAAGVEVVGFGRRPGGPVVTDPDGTHRRWLAGLGAAAAAVRPDHYVFAAGADARAVAAELLAVLAGRG
ncbi:bifunctional 3-(3-hydroxy-phenyl)propionate/3-hydroxycinnamic acid hydroxylase [Amycolatopsis sp. PS_44_ISF1]|uniref:bifunctional 3-(3-hydroxy-phenyl)propionate/3-hydroxycinnamic acid hydroxylase n=1 Tax=Amycolatopsis sp. PS_44_ISF1 TaxID=2974917 RepID=UPI0028E03DEC|nr:bifunctional 3-(3-hydroxy-phenyl)propionate/3-hydroxycinnamic acid hydroxylase [Amycolatopsis sp. PS_44_ISF1]MDT8912568.1 bifunctional 3-(3-hydroxy-phenyl)propionate/3-hydroxycinnamic acid hydroxylase [Amycolatopsis sp. PS_44_ISF1]